nr:MAG TPA: hypothetical protein [Caudoviricetes sp.]
MFSNFLDINREIIFIPIKPGTKYCKIAGIF